MTQNLICPQASVLPKKPDTPKPEGEKTGKASDTYKKAFWNQLRSKNGSNHTGTSAMHSRKAQTPKADILCRTNFEHTLVTAMNNATIIRPLAHVISPHQAAHIKFPLSHRTAALRGLMRKVHTPRVTKPSDRLSLMRIRSAQLSRCRRNS